MRRREVLSGGLAASVLGARAPASIAAESARPKMPYGPMSGDLLADRAIVWGAADRPARMVVEWSREPDFRGAVRRMGSLATPETGLTAKLDLDGLPAGADVHYRVAFHDPDNARIISPWSAARFRVPDVVPRRVRFTFSGDEAGQYYGINPAWGGYRLYEAMRQERPDVFVHLGDQIYADNPIGPKPIDLGGGRFWENLHFAPKDHLAETLDDFRGNFAYNLLDKNKRAFLAEVPMLAQWDDHEVRNNWDLEKAVKSGPSMPELAARARRATIEYNPMRMSPTATGIERSFALGPLLEIFLLDARSHRGPNSGAGGTEPGAGMYGDRQMAWLKQGLAASRAVWKIIACEMPLSLTVGDPPAGQEALSNGRPGKPGGREAQLADLLSFIRAQGIANTVWTSADVHHACAIHYHPDRAAFSDFLPFWEIVSGPINAGTFGPGTADPTFGPEIVYNTLTKPVAWLNPTEGKQFYGLGDIDPQTRALTLSIHDLTGRELWTKTLEAAPR